MPDLVKWDPFGELQRVRDDVGRIFGRIFPWDFRSDEFFSGLRTPVVDVKETDTHYIVSAEIPGVDPQDLEVTVTEEALTLRGEVRERTEQNETGYRRVERRYGAFHRTIPFPSPVDAKQAMAEYINGVLEVRLPKVDPTKGKGVRLTISTQRQQPREH
jgi:Molecular chaperone (small heat shock protein)